MFKYLATTGGVALLLPSFALAQVEDVFDDIEDKGNTLVDFFTTGWFAFVIVVSALLYVTFSVLNGRMELQRGIIIIIACVVIGNVPTIASWLLGI